MFIKENRRYQWEKHLQKETIHAKGIDIGIYTTDFENEFISLADIAKYRNEDDPRFVIQNWMRNRNTIEFLAVWEELHNPDFNRVQFEAVKNEVGLNRFVMTPTKWIEQMNAIGIVSKAGRYGGTYAHSDIAMSFVTWLSPEFQLYIMKDYRRLKIDENSRLSLTWNLNREISKLNYRIHTDAIKTNLIPPELTAEQISFTYASEADLLNVALFGKTAKQWRAENPDKKGNIRDQVTFNQLLVLANMESYNAILIEQGKSQPERLIALHDLAVRQMQTMESLNTSGLPQREIEKQLYCKICKKCHSHADRWLLIGCNAQKIRMEAFADHNDYEIVGMGTYNGERIEILCCSRTDIRYNNRDNTIQTVFGINNFVFRYWKHTRR